VYCNLYWFISTRLLHCFPVTFPPWLLQVINFYMVAAVSTQLVHLYRFLRMVSFSLWSGALLGRIFLFLAFCLALPVKSPISFFINLKFNIFRNLLLSDYSLLFSSLVFPCQQTLSRSTTLDFGSYS
jgi:hypothetical protein